MNKRVFFVLLCITFGFLPGTAAAQAFNYFSDQPIEQRKNQIISLDSSNAWGNSLYASYALRFSEAGRFEFGYNFYIFSIGAAFGGGGKGTTGITGKIHILGMNHVRVYASAGAGGTISLFGNAEKYQNVAIGAQIALFQWLYAGPEAGWIFKNGTHETNWDQSTGAFNKYEKKSSTFAAYLNFEADFAALF